MKITDYIRNIFSRWSNNTIYDRSLAHGFGDFRCSTEPFADLVFYNICDLMTDLTASVTFMHKGGDLALFAGFKAFFDAWGKYVLNVLFESGYVVIGRRQNDTYFWVMSKDEYTEYQGENDLVKVKPIKDDVEVYVITSQTKMLKGKSDKELLRPFLRYMDNVLNGSSTIAERLGAVIIMSPQQASGSPMNTIISQKEKEDLEKEVGEKYGFLRKQSSVMILPNAMNIQTVSLAQLDQRTVEKVKVAITAICDRIKVPANQVAILDANNSKAFANGTELREGDIIKYRNFRRLLNQTFWQFAENIGLQVDYTIENEPQQQLTI